MIGEASSCQSLITKINNIFELKHVTKLWVHQDLKFLGHRLVKHHDGSISISLEQDYYLNMLKPFNLHHDNVLDQTAGPDPDPEMFSKPKTCPVLMACWTLQVENPALGGALERLRILSTRIVSCSLETFGSKLFCKECLTPIRFWREKLVE